MTLVDSPSVLHFMTTSKLMTDGSDFAQYNLPASHTRQSSFRQNGLESGQACVSKALPVVLQMSRNRPLHFFSPGVQEMVLQAKSTHFCGSVQFVSKRHWTHWFLEIAQYGVSGKPAQTEFLVHAGPV